MKPLSGGANSSNDTAAAGTRGVDGNIQVRKGNRIPLIPRHMLKVSADYQLTPAFSAGASMVGVSSSYARGNENNAHQADGVYYLGSGKSAGYAVFNLGANGFTADGNFIARPFSPASNAAIVHSTSYAPGAPRTLQIGMCYEFDLK